MSDDLFAAEEAVVAEAEGRLANGSFAGSEEKQQFEALLKAYRKLLKVTRRLTRLSDANERQLNAVSGTLAEKNRELEALSHKLGKYLSPQVYDSIFTGAQKGEISSTRKKLTIFFSDVANFTETTDSLESEDLTNLVNHYLTEMAKIALEFGGTLDKYIGDAVMVFFGDPDSKGVKEDARACVRMAIAMQRRMRELQSEWTELGAERPFQLRIGVNTAYVTVGNFGSQQRMDYTIIGNGVNMTARLQSHAELDGIIIGHETYALVKDEIDTEEQPPIKVKGFAEPIRCYKVLGIYDDLAEQGLVIREQREGFKFLLDLQKEDKAAAISTLEAILSRLKEEKRR